MPRNHCLHSNSLLYICFALLVIRFMSASDILRQELQYLELSVAVRSNTHLITAEQNKGYQVSSVQYYPVKRVDLIRLHEARKCCRRVDLWVVRIR